MYMVVGYGIMYGGDIFLSTITGSGAVEGGEENATYAPSRTSSSRWFCCHGMSIVQARWRASEAFCLPSPSRSYDRIYLPDGR
ncbi:MAG: hypothetical protein CM15mP74_37370 [Halieaceae bacterium]|nr:MAG: hypothetical protein CM15mP74_37370 [Halieaceae bacterium]